MKYVQSAPQTTSHPVSTDLQGTVGESIHDIRGFDLKPISEGEDAVATQNR
jgi:hypothetical protein